MGTPSASSSVRYERSEKDLFLSLCKSRQRVKEPSCRRGEPEKEAEKGIKNNLVYGVPYPNHHKRMRQLYKRNNKNKSGTLRPIFLIFCQS